MKLWIAYNGYLGYGPVGCIVEAEDEESARKAATAAFDAHREDEDPDYAIVREIGELKLPYVGDTL